MKKISSCCFKRTRTGRLLTLFLLLLINSRAYGVTDNLNFSGNLVADPCVLDPETEVIELDFDTIIDKYLYINQRTHSQPFTVRLLECDLSLGTTVSLTFSGAADSELTDMLAVTGMARGIAIGLETTDGVILPFNKATPAFELTAGTTELVLKGYVQGRPTAIQNRSIIRGKFSAVATFTLNYE
ncbi:exotoxin [Pantoea graminicola]|uniref:fimbrial protein n=1 Tax=unclassified Pantoea TaxID=2630326 RepID=UPI000DA7E0E4|nr:fimbrial protein [Pantoea sp. ARC607]PZL90846.1 exotoxin [Pantoea sp. ARC607]